MAIKYTVSIESKRLLDEFKRECKKRGHSQAYVVNRVMRFFVEHSHLDGWREGNGGEEQAKKKKLVDSQEHPNPADRAWVTRKKNNEANPEAAAKGYSKAAHKASVTRHINILLRQGKTSEAVSYHQKERGSSLKDAELAIVNLKKRLEQSNRQRS